MDATKNTNNDILRGAMVDKALHHVVFDGWSESTLEKVRLELNLSVSEAQVLFPRGALDMALLFHERDDQKFLKQVLMSEFNKSGCRVRDRIEFAINSRLEISEKNKEAVKRSVALLTTPLYFHEGGRALWRTSDRIWNSIGDETHDLNWYSKRVILSSVYSTVLVFWLDDESTNFEETRAFVKRRIENIMTVEKLKRTAKKAPVLGVAFERFESFAQGMLALKKDFPGWQHK